MCCCYTYSMFKIVALKLLDARSMLRTGVHQYVQDKCTLLTLMCLFQSKWPMKAGLKTLSFFMPPVLELHHLCGVKIGVSSLAGVCCPGPLFQELVVLWSDMEKKSCQVYRASFCQASFSNKWLAYLPPFPPFVCSHWVWEQIMTLTIMCDVFAARVHAHTLKRRGCLQRKRWIRKGKCQLLSCYCTTISH